jgi:hypothetical protein
MFTSITGLTRSREGSAILLNAKSGQCARHSIWPPAVSLNGHGPSIFLPAHESSFCGSSNSLGGTARVRPARRFPCMLLDGRRPFRPVLDRVPATIAGFRCCSVLEQFTA